MELLQFMEQTQCFGVLRLIYIITSFLVSGNLVSPRRRLLLTPFQRPVYFCSFYQYFMVTFKQEKKTETSPSDATDRFGRAAFSSIASLSSFPCRLPGAAGTQHTKETGFLQAKDVCTFPVSSCSRRGWLASLQPRAAQPPWRRPRARTGLRGRAPPQTLQTFFMYCLIETKETFSAPTSSATNCSIER